MIQDVGMGEIDMKDIMASIAEEESKYREKNNEVLNRISHWEDDDFMERLEEYLITDITTSNYEIVKEVPRQLRDEGDTDEEYELTVYVNQTTNGGYTGDDFAGTMWIALPTSGRYLKVSYSCY